MSNATREAEEQELNEMERQLTQAAEADKAKAAQVDVAPSPEPEPTPTPEAPPVEEPPVTPTPSEAEKPKDDPLKWAEKKGFKSPEDMARALLQKEQEFHASRQKAEREAAAPPPPPAWQPRPDMGYLSPPPPFYPPQPPQRNDAFRQVAAMYPQLAPEDVERIMPLMVDVAQSTAAQVRREFGQQFSHIQRQTERNNELMQLMQDPAFKDPRVQQEIHAVLDTDPSLFQRPGAYGAAFEKALSNMQRKQLQQGVTQELPSGQRPPVTAGGGNGSANTMPRKITEAEFNSWTPAQMEAYLNSNGRVIPKK